MRNYKYTVHGTHNGRSVVIEAPSLKDAVKQYLKTFPQSRVKYAAKIQWESPAFRVGRKTPGQAQDEYQAYDAALKEFLA